MGRRIHIVGAGLAGLSAAVRLAGRGCEVDLYEATSLAGGRCRSYADRTLGQTIDNGNHIILSGNRSALDFLRAIGAQDRLRETPAANFPFLDLTTGERWNVRFGARLKGLSLRDNLALLSLIWRRRDCPVGEALRCAGPGYERMLRPMLTAALNVDPPEGSALLVAALLRHALLKGARGSRPLAPRESLTETFVEPALSFLAKRGVKTHFREPAQAIEFDGARASALVLRGARIPLGPTDGLIVAVPAPAAVQLVPGLTAPSEFRAIVNLHFRVPDTASLPPILGVTGGLSEWIFALPGRVSVTISNADRLLQRGREELARAVWDEVSRALDLPADLPRWQVVRERRATFAAIPRQQARRPGARTRWPNLMLAGDWIDTGLPATIEGAVRAGERAAALSLEAA